MPVCWYADNAMIWRVYVCAVNNLFVSKLYGPEIPFLIDDFAMWTMPYVWILSNLWYWPFYNSVGLTCFFAICLGFWITVNGYRVWWNYQNKKRGLWEPTKALYRYLRTEYRRHLAPDLYEMEAREGEEEDEEEEAAPAVGAVAAPGAAQPAAATAGTDSTGTSSTTASSSEAGASTTAAQLSPDSVAIPISNLMMLASAGSSVDSSATTSETARLLPSSTDTTHSGAIHSSTMQGIGVASDDYNEEHMHADQIAQTHAPMDIVENYGVVSSSSSASSAVDASSALAAEGDEQAESYGMVLTPSDRNAEEKKDNPFDDLPLQ